MLKKYSFLIGLVGLLGIIQIIFTGITYDESYYWIYSKFLDFGYFDHPPMVAMFVWLGEILGHGEFYTRIIFLITSLISFLLLGKMIHPKNRFTLFLMILSLPLLMSYGLLALPDTPLLFFSILLWFFTEKYVESDELKYSLVIGIIISLLFYSKYHGALVVIFTVLGNIKLIKRKSFYLIIIVVAICYFPHILWQYNHDFISFKFHLFGRREKHFELLNIVNYILGVVFSCGFLAFFYFLFNLKKKNILKDKMYFLNSYGFFIFIFFLSLRNQIELNWIVTACTAFAIFSLRTKINNKVVNLLLLPMLLISFSFRLILINDFGLRSKIERLNEIHGWKERFSKFYALSLNKTIVFDNYQYGARFSYEKDTLYPVRHLRSRESQYSLLKLTDLYGIMDTDNITFVGTKKMDEAIKIETNYKDPIYIKRNTSLKYIEEKYE